MARCSPGFVAERKQGSIVSFPNFCKNVAGELLIKSLYRFRCTISQGVETNTPAIQSLEEETKKVLHHMANR